MITLPSYNRNSLFQFLIFIVLFSTILGLGYFIGNLSKKCQSINSFCPSSFPPESSETLSLIPNKEISDIYSFEYPNNFFIDLRDYEYISVTNKIWQGVISHYPIIAVKQYISVIPDEMDLNKWLEGVGDSNPPIGSLPAKSCKGFISELKNILSQLGLKGEDCLYYGVSDIKNIQFKNLPAITFKTANVSESGTHTLVRYKNLSNVTTLVDIYKTITGLTDDKTYNDSKIDQAYQMVLDSFIFAPPNDLKTNKIPIKLFYYNTKADIKGDCSADAVLPVEREIPKTQTPIQDTIVLLIQGKITGSEKSRGFSSEFPHEGFSLSGTKLDKGVLTLDFPVIPAFTSGGSCRIGIIRSEIEKTARQFPDVKEVRYFDPELFQP